MKINTIRLRALIGWLGMLLPWIVVILIGYFPASISATWYTNACTSFMIILGAASFLLICYKGYSKVDDILLTCSGIAGLLVCLFPTSIPEYPGKIGTFMVDCNISSAIHNVSAVVFFALLAYNSFFLFTLHLTYNPAFGFMFSLPFQGKLPFFRRYLFHRCPRPNRFAG